MRLWRNDLPAASSTADTLAITPLLLLLFVLPPTPALGQTCEQPIQSILPKPCQNIVTYPLVYVSPGQSQRLVSVLTSKLLKPFIASPTTCQAAASSFICAFSYPQCRWSNSSSSPSPPTPPLVLSSNSSSSKSAAAFYQARKDAATAVNIPPCRSSCHAFLQACALLFEDLLPYDCNQLPPNPASLLPLLSHSSSSSPLPSPSAILSSTRQKQEEKKASQQQQTCFLPAAYNGTYPIYLCPDDLGLVAEDGRCVSSCKSPIWTTSEWNTFHIILNVGGWVSAFGVLFVIITFLLDPWKTGRKSHFVIYLCIAELICAVNFVWASPYGHFNILCDGQHRNFDGPLCIAWSSVFVWSSWTATAWWFNVVLNVQLVGWRRRLGLQRKSFLLWNKVILVGHHVWGWGAGLLVVIIGVVVGKNGAAPGYPICLYQQDDTSDPTSMSFWALSLYYIPINIAVLIGFLLMVGLAWRIYKTLSSTGLFKQWRLLALLFLLSIVYSFPSATMFSVQQHHVEIAESLARWVTCQLISDTAVGSELDDSCSRGERPNFILMCFTCFCVAFQALPIVILFGFTKENFRFYRLGLSNLLSGRSFYYRQPASSIFVALDAMDAEEYLYDDEFSGIDDDQDDDDEYVKYRRKEKDASEEAEEEVTRLVSRPARLGCVNFGGDEEEAAGVAALLPPSLPQSKEPLLLDLTSND